MTELFGPHRRVGIWLSERRAEASLIERRRKGWKLIAEAKAELPNIEAQGLQTAFAALRRDLPKHVRRADMPVSLALPERFIIEEVLEFEAFPEAAEEASALVQQRCGRELDTDPETLAISHEIFRGTTPLRCRVRVMTRDLRDRIEHAARLSGFRLTRLDGWLGYAGSDDMFAGSMALWADDTDWTLACQAPDHPEGFTDAGRVNEPGTLERITRLVRTYALRQQVTDPTVAIDAHADMFDALKAMLADGHIRCEPMTLPPLFQSRAGRIAAWG